jgi:hypothetical protein
MIDAADIGLLQAGVQRAFGSGAATDGVDQALDDLGWREALAAEGATIVPLLFAAKGGAAGAGTAMDDLLAVALGAQPGADVSVVQPEPGLRALPGLISASGGLRVRGAGTTRLLRGGTAIVAVSAASGQSRLVEADAADLVLRPVGGIDPEFGLVTVSADSVPCRPVPEPAPGSGPLPGSVASPAGTRWSAVTAVAQLAISFELAGAARAMLELTREHALTRVQFGHPIGAFQAVRHRLADSLVAVEGMAAAAQAAWQASGYLAGPAGPDAHVLAAIAKAVAGRNARTVARNCQQVLAGVGFTAEHPFHHYVRRVLLLDELFGSAAELTRELGRDLLQARRLPAPIPL